MPRGAQNLPKEKLKEWGSLGGRKSQDSGVGRQWTSEEAKKAGSKGGLAKAENRRKKDASNKGPNRLPGENKGTPSEEE